MLVAVKENKEVPIQENEKHLFLNEGYDVLTIENGKVKNKEKGKGAKVSYEDYQRVVQENEKLKKENEKLKKSNNA